jgi:small subunit ribosomal protein S13e
VLFFKKLKMARMHNKRKGIASSSIPYKRKSPDWTNQTIQEINSLIIKLAKKGLVPSQIGVYLRDCKGVPQVKTLTGNKILRILKINGLAPELPEDLFFLIKKSINVRKHLERNKKDKDSKFRLILIESKIHRVIRYYKKKKQISPSWKYESSTPSSLKV